SAGPSACACLSRSAVLSLDTDLALNNELVSVYVRLFQRSIERGDDRLLMEAVEIYSAPFLYGERAPSPALNARRSEFLRGWITYSAHFYKDELRPTLRRIDAYVICWSRRKFKRMRHRTNGARDWFDRFRRANPHLFAHWVLCYGNGRTSGAM